MDNLVWNFIKTINLRWLWVWARKYYYKKWRNYELAEGRSMIPMRRIYEPRVLVCDEKLSGGKNLEYVCMIYVKKTKQGRIKFGRDGRIHEPPVEEYIEEEKKRHDDWTSFCCLPHKCGIGYFYATDVVEKVTCIYCRLNISREKFNISDLNYKQGNLIKGSVVRLQNIRKA